MKRLKGYAMVASAAFIWGTAATAAKLLLSRDINTVLLVQTRVTFSAIVLGTVLAVLRPELLRVRPADLWRLALLGILGIAGSNFTYYFVIKEASVSVAILLQYTAPLLIMAYAAVTKEEDLTPLKVFSACAALLGCALSVGAFQRPSLPVGGPALALGILSAFTFAFMTVFTRHLLARYSLWTVTLYGLLFASLFWLLINPPWRIVEESPTAPLWAALVALAIFSVLIPHSLFFAGLRHVVPARAIIISTLEPVVAIATAALVTGERFGAVQAAGAVLVLGAVVILQLRREVRGEELAEETRADH
ncbi:MAG TPA: EamA family transporter [Bacteroidota bacterium]|nr:EamA family transporter [Bacteroidota bacterium]